MSNQPKSNKIDESFLAMPYSIIKNEDLSWSEKVVLAYYRSWERQYGRCDVSMSKMSKALGFGKRTVQLAKKSLIEKGYIIHEAGAKSAPAKDQPVQILRQRSANDAPEPVQNPDPLAPKSLSVSTEEKSTDLMAEFESLFGTKSATPKNR
jgi:hypothetical protein